MGWYITFVQFSYYTWFALMQRKWGGGPAAKDPWQVDVDVYTHMHVYAYIYLHICLHM